MILNKSDHKVSKYIQAHYSELMAFVYSKLKSNTIADDIVQESFLRFIAQNEKDEVKNPRAYLYRIAHNLVIDEFRKTSVHQQYIVHALISENIKTNNIYAEKLVEDKQKLNFLAIAINELPSRCRLVFRMKKIELKSTDEIVKILGISRNMVEKHLRHALLHCKRRVAEMELGQKN